MFRGKQPTLHIAHRGGALVAPENTLAAFRQAVESWKTDMLELDVHFSRDGVAWVSHDPTVDRCTDGQGAIADLSTRELEALDAGARFTSDGTTFPFRGQGIRLPRLAQVCEQFKDVLLNIDLKVDRPGAAQALRDELVKAGAVARVCWGAEWDRVAEQLSALLPDACLFYPRDALTAFVMSVRMGEAPPVDKRFHVLDMPLEFEGVRLIDDALLTAAREAGKWTNVWTVDDQAQMRELVSLGVGGIMTDRPDHLRAVLAQAASATGTRR
jgi:glycerophosphoryl diester phosphodiesterase